MKVRIVNIPSTATILAWGGILLFGAVLILLFFKPIPHGNENTLNLCLGALMGWVGATFAFYFGDSKKSQTHADTINNLSSIPPSGGAAAPTVTATITSAPTPQSGQKTD